MRRQAAFTLIEVTLAIVVEIILIAGATLLYNQAKLGAGNTRAKAKTAALQSLVEEMAANAGGSYPSVPAVYTLWAQQRPDDVGSSPWGGPAGTASGHQVNQQGFFGEDLTSWSGTSQADTYPIGQGDLQYDRFLFTATTSAYDVSIASGVTVKNHFVTAYGPNDGEHYMFVMTGK